MHKMLLDEIVLVCKRIEAEGDNQISKSFSKEMLENGVIEQDRQLEAAKQRELELLAVIENTPLALSDGHELNMSNY